MTLLGNICLALAVVIFLGPFLYVLHGPVERGSHGNTESLINFTLCLAAMGAFLTVALCAATSLGGLDWLGWVRPGQYTMVIVTGIAWMVATWFCGALRGEPVTDIPWVVRPFTPWAAYLLPLLLLLLCGAALHPELSSRVPAWVMRTPALLAGGFSLLLCVGLLGELFVSMQQRQIAGVERQVEFQNSRDTEMLQKVQQMDPAQDVRELLNFSNKFEIPAIRDLALQKVRTRPNLTADIAECLRNGCRDEAFTFLESNDPPDQKALAEPIREGFALAAADALQQMQSDEHLYDDTFDWTVTKMLAIADRYKSFGVDYAGPLRDFRKALDQPRSQKIHPQCRAALDQWLARASKK